MYCIVCQMDLVKVDRWLESNNYLILSVLITSSLAVLVAFILLFVSKLLHRSLWLDRILFGKLS